MIRDRCRLRTFKKFSKPLKWIPIHQLARLSFYMTPDECIPLDSKDIFWRTLDISPVTSLQSDSICCDTELNHVKEHFNKQSDAGKRSILRKLVDIFNPSKTTINPPPVKQNTRERPSLKKQQQQQRKHVPLKSSRPGRVFGIDSNVEPERQSYGNCGFRSVALVLGLPGDYWPRIRRELVQELESRQHEYRWMFGTKDYNNIYNTVNNVGL
nr:hypothetical protein [Tanacetum cinerariifolium]